MRIQYSILNTQYSIILYEMMRSARGSALEWVLQVEWYLPRPRGGNFERGEEMK